jgi:DNA-binding GntR family transcriptional regulator
MRKTDARDGEFGRVQFTPIATDTASNLVYRELKHAIRAAHFQPGEVVSLRGLAQELGVSETPVRDALKRLQEINAIEVLPNRTFRFPIVTIEKLSEILAVRLVLEGTATELAAASMSSETIEALDGLRKEEIEAGEQRNVVRVMDLNARFHEELYEAAGNETLATLIEQLWLRMAPTFRATVEKMLTPDFAPRNPLPSDWLFRHHTRIVQKLKARDAAGARSALESDLMDFNRVFLAIHGSGDQVPAPAKSGRKRRA